MKFELMKGPGIDTLRATVVADEDGRFSELPFPDLACVLLALFVRPGTPAPGAAFDVRLTEPDNFDVFCGCGIGLRPDRTSRKILRWADADCHPVVEAGEDLQLRIEGNTTPGAVVTVEIRIGEPFLAYPEVFSEEPR